MNCALCNDILDESLDSREHLILNAIGGRRKVSGVLCIRCNSTSGADWDSELADQLNPLALLFGVQRQDGQVPAQKFETVGGDRFWKNPDGTMSPAAVPYRKIPKDGGGSEIQISARSVADARKILKGVAEKYPEVDYERVLATAEWKTDYLDDVLKISLDVGGERAGRSIVKSALCLAISEGVDPMQCASARSYLKDEKAEPCFGFYYARDLVRNRPPRVPLHCVAVSNRGCDGQLLAYVEFFGFHRMVVCLADTFEGPDVHASYAVNPMTGKELALNVELTLSRAEVAATYAYERIPEGTREAALAELIPVAQKLSFERERDRAISRAFQCAMQTCGVPEGGELPVEKRWEFSRLMAEQMMPFLTRHLNRRRES
jgi:hypothetical protein